jgi:hypothetical protein
MTTGSRDSTFPQESSPFSPVTKGPAFPVPNVPDRLKTDAHQQLKGYCWVFFGVAAKWVAQKT